MLIVAPLTLKTLRSRFEFSFVALFISYKSCGEKLTKYQANSSCVIMSVILMTTLFYKTLILQGEFWCWSLLGLKGLTSTLTMPNERTKASSWTTENFYSWSQWYHKFNWKSKLNKNFYNQTYLTCPHYHHCWVYDHRKVVQLLPSLMLLLWSHQHFPKKTKKIRRWILQKVHTHCRKQFIYHETPVILQTLIPPSRVHYCIIHSIYLPSDTKYYSNLSSHVAQFIHTLVLHL